MLCGMGLAHFLKFKKWLKLFSSLSKRYCWIIISLGIKDHLFSNLQLTSSLFDMKTDVTKILDNTSWILHYSFFHRDDRSATHSEKLCYACRKLSQERLQSPMQIYTCRVIIEDWIFWGKIWIKLKMEMGNVSKRQQPDQRADECLLKSNLLAKSNY